MFAFNIVINFFAIQAFTKKYDDFKIFVCIMFFENLGECREILVYLCNKLYEFNCTITTLQLYDYMFARRFLISDI